MLGTQHHPLTGEEASLTGFTGEPHEAAARLQSVAGGTLQVPRGGRGLASPTRGLRTRGQQAPRLAP